MMSTDQSPNVSGADSSRCPTSPAGAGVDRGGHIHLHERLLVSVGPKCLRTVSVKHIHAFNTNSWRILLK